MLPDGGRNRLWLMDLVSGVRSRLSTDDRSYLTSVWTADGDLVYADGGAGEDPRESEIMRFRPDGDVRPEVVAHGLLPSVSRGGGTLVYTVWNGDREWDIADIDLSAGGDPVFLHPETGWQYAPRLSPDGTRLAYLSRESGRDEVFLCRFPRGTTSGRSRPAAACGPTGARTDAVYGT